MPSRQILELERRRALQIRRIEGVDCEGFPQCPMLREDVVERSAGDGRVAEGNYPGAAAGARRLHGLPISAVMPGASSSTTSTWLPWKPWIFVPWLVDNPSAKLRRERHHG